MRQGRGLGGDWALAAQHRRHSGAALPTIYEDMKLVCILLQHPLPWPPPPVPVCSPGSCLLTNINLGKVAFVVNVVLIARARLSTK